MLHSWGQNLSLHPHIHCIVPAAGYSLKGDWEHIGTYEGYLYPVHQLSAAFKGKFLDSLERSLRKIGMNSGFDPLLQQAWNKPWVVFCESSLAKSEYVIRYLGQYTHRVAISNDRILRMSKTHVTFIAKDYRDRAQNKPVTITGVEFLHRFCLHILPKRFVKIRRFGIYNHTTKRNLKLQFKQEEPIIEKENSRQKETSQEQILKLTGFDIGQCPKCKKGRMIIVRELPRIRSPCLPLRQLIHTFLQ